MHVEPSTSKSVTFGDRLWVLIVAGISVGVLVTGVAGRMAMLILRLTSPDHVRGVVSDDGFEIGRFTLSGTYNLMMVGAGIGLIGACLYTWVAPWLIGPVWFRRATTAVACGAVVGSTLVKNDGVDFNVLEPAWLAVALFVAIPALFGWFIGVAVDRARVVVHRPRGRWWWAAPVALVVCFPFVVFLLVPIVVVLAVWSWLHRFGPWDGAVRVSPLAFVVRGGWLTVAVVGVRELAMDISAVAG